MLLDLVGKHRGVGHGLTRHERAAEARAEVGRRLLDAGLGAGELRGVAIDEVVLRLLGRELRDRGQHAEGVRREEDHVLRVRAHGRHHRVRHEVERVGDAGVLGARRAVVVGDAGHRVDHHVLDHAAEADGVPDLRLALLAQVDALGVAAALEVEDAAVRPAVLVVADQAALRVGAERGLAGAGEAEEDGHVRRIVLRHVGRAVHREHADLGEVVVHGVEDRLLDLARVPGADDEHQLSLQALDDAELVLDAVLGGVLKLQARGIDDGPVVGPVRQLVRLGVDEERLGEQAVPGLLGEDRDLEAVGGVRAGVSVETEDVLLGAHVLHHLGVDGVEVGRGNGLVDLAPGNVAVDLGGVLEELVVRAAAGAGTRVAVEGAVGGQHALATGDRQFHQAGGGEVRVDGGGAKLVLGTGGGGAGGGHGFRSPKKRGEVDKDTAIRGHATPAEAWD